MRSCLCAALLLTGLISHTHSAERGNGKRTKVLIVTGGCCHDYAYQSSAILKAAAKNGLKADWTIVQHGGTGTSGKTHLYDNPNWADGYDVVIHNECFAKTTDENYIRKITAAHKAGANAVVIHCAMHTYRDAKIDDWREFLGVTSRRHEHKSEYSVRNEATEHPIMQGFPAIHTMPIDELYVIEKTWPNTEVLATSVSERNEKLHPVIWTNTYGKARVFGTTYGHSTETFTDTIFLNTLVRGIKWAAHGE